MTFLMKYMFVLFISLFAINSAVLAEERVIRIGTEGNWKPFSYLDESGNLVGFEIDLAKAACEKAKVKCEFVTMPWQGLIVALNENKIDAIASGMRMTPKHLKVVDFLTPYYLNTPIFSSCGLKDLKDNTPETLNGLRVGVQAGTTNHDYLKKKYPNLDIREYKAVDDMRADLLSGRIDLGFEARTSNYYFLKSEKGKDCVTVGETVTDPEFFYYPSGIAVRKGDSEISNLLDVGVKTILEDGTYEEINSKYWPFSVKYTKTD